MNTRDPNHTSETDLDEYIKNGRFHTVIHNESTLNDLNKKAEQLVIQLVVINESNSYLSVCFNSNNNVFITPESKTAISVRVTW